MKHWMRLPLSSLGGRWMDLSPVHKVRTVSQQMTSKQDEGPLHGKNASQIRLPVQACTQMSDISDQDTCLAAMSKNKPSVSAATL